MTSEVSGMNGVYLDWGVVHISLTNLLIVALMVVAFALAVLVPFRAPGDDDDGESS
jgi:hypothetical protein